MRMQKEIILKVEIFSAARFQTKKKRQKDNSRGKYTKTQFPLQICHLHFYFVAIFFLGRSSSKTVRRTRAKKLNVAGRGAEGRGARLCECVFVALPKTRAINLLFDGDLS